LEKDLLQNERVDKEKIVQKKKKEEITLNICIYTFQPQIIKLINFLSQTSFNPYPPIPF